MATRLPRFIQHEKVYFSGSVAVPAVRFSWEEDAELNRQELSIEYAVSAAEFAGIMIATKPPLEIHLKVFPSLDFLLCLY